MVTSKVTDMTINMIIWSDGPARMVRIIVSKEDVFTAFLMSWRCVILFRRNEEYCKINVFLS